MHEDDRRILESWPEAKIITTKQHCVLGNHLHKVKTEKFILSKGSATVVLDGQQESMKIGKIITINPGVVHSFILKNDSVLIGLCSHPYDPSDDYKIN